MKSLPQDEVCREIALYDYYVCKHILSNMEVSEVLDYIALLKNEHVFKKAGVGKGDSFQLNASIRNDEIYWLDDESELPFVLKSYVQQIDELIFSLNRYFFAGIKSKEMMLARYDAGGHYTKHLDNFRNTNHRVFTCILYLNPNWEVQHGGQLKIYSKEKELVVSPEAGTWCIFKSDTIAHEVLPSHRERLSLTIWLRKD